MEVEIARPAASSAALLTRIPVDSRSDATARADCAFSSEFLARMAEIFVFREIIGCEEQNAQKTNMLIGMAILEDEKLEVQSSNFEKGYLKHRKCR